MRIIFISFFISFLLIGTLILPVSVTAEPRNPYTIGSESDRIIIYEKGAKDPTDSHKKDVKRNAWIESGRGAYNKNSTHFYFSTLYSELGQVLTEQAIFDSKGRPIESNQTIKDPSFANISQRRLLSNVAYDSNDKPISYKEEIFITANDYLTNSVVRLFSTEEIFKIQYDDSRQPAVILGNTEVVISDDKGNTLLTINGSFTKRARYDLSGKITGYSRYGIDNIVVGAGAGEIIITAPPSMAEGEKESDYRVGIVNIKDEKMLREILNKQTFINQLLARFGLSELFYKAFYSEKFYTSLTYLQIENSPEEVMSLNNITLAFKNLISQRQQAYALFQNDVDMYYEKLAKTLFEHTQLWWDRDVIPQEYYAGDDKILSKQEYRKMIDDAIVSLSSNAGTLNAPADLPKDILSLEHYLRSQMLMNSKLIYIQNLKNAVSDTDRQISRALNGLGRPVLISEKGNLEALIVLPEKKSRK